MNSPRNAQLDALLARVSTAQLNGQPAFVTTSRRFRHWDEVSDAETPCCFITKGFEFGNQDRSRGETKWRSKALFWIYCLHSPDADSIPGALLNDLLDAVDAVMMPAPYEDRVTLGNLVDHAYIDGESIVSEGSLPSDRMSLALVPITIETGV